MSVHTGACRGPLPIPPTARAETGLAHHYTPMAGEGRRGGGEGGGASHCSSQCVHVCLVSVTTIHCTRVSYFVQVILHLLFCYI